MCLTRWVYEMYTKSAQITNSHETNGSAIVIIIVVVVVVYFTFVAIVLLHHCLGDAVLLLPLLAVLLSHNFHSEINVCLDCVCTGCWYIGTETDPLICSRTNILICEIFVFLSTHRNTTNTHTCSHTHRNTYTQVGVWIFQQLMLW